MDRDFWLERWDLGQIGFHQDRVHPDLEEHAAWLAPRAARVLVPLCGKSWDLPWLARRGSVAVGVELAEKAVRALMDEHSLDHEVEERGSHRVFVGENLEVYCGDFFELPTTAGPFDAVWDRAALVALAPEQRQAYAAHLRALAPGARMLLNVVEYDQDVMSGPPHSVSPDLVRSLYGADRVEVVEERDVLAAEPRWRERGHDWFRTWLLRVSL